MELVLRLHGKAHRVGMGDGAGAKVAARNSNLRPEVSSSQGHVQTTSTIMIAGAVYLWKQHCGKPWGCADLFGGIAGVSIGGLGSLPRRCRTSPEAVLLIMILAVEAEMCMRRDDAECRTGPDNVLIVRNIRGSRVGFRCC